MRLFKLVALSSLICGVGFAQGPSVNAGGVINGASLTAGQAVAPGSLVAIFGTGLASSLLGADTVPLSTSLGNTSVTFNGIPAALYFVSPLQVNAQVPWNATPDSSGNVAVVVTAPGGASKAVATPLAGLSPGIFTIPPGGGYAIAINADGSLAAPGGAIPGIATHPAKVGDTLVVLASGLGAVDSPVANGAASLDRLRNTLTVPVVLIGSASAKVVFSGLTPQFPGINQLNVVVPTVGAGNSLPIQLQEGGITSPASAVIAIQ
jgi:uncharacterized protein (TIGR03437 family)